MKSRFFARFENATRVFPYLLSLTAITFAVACGNNNNKQKVSVGPVQPKAEQPKLSKLFPKTDLTNPANLDLALRIEGATLELEPIDDEKKIFNAAISLLVRKNSAENNEAKKAVQIQAEGELHAGLQEAIKKASAEQDKATAKELFRKSFLLINKEASSVDASEQYAVQAFCIEDCKRVAIRILEADQTLSAASSEGGQKEGGLDETRYNRQVSIEFAPEKEAAAAEVAVYRIAQFNIGAVTEGRGDEAKKIDPSKLTKLSFEEAVEAREKNGTLDAVVPPPEAGEGANNEGAAATGNGGTENKEQQKQDQSSGRLEELDPMRESEKTEKTEKSATAENSEKK